MILDSAFNCEFACKCSEQNVIKIKIWAHEGNITKMFFERITQKVQGDFPSFQKILYAQFYSPWFDHAILTCACLLDQDCDESWKDGSGGKGINVAFPQYVHAFIKAHNFSIRAGQRSTLTTVAEFIRLNPSPTLSPVVCRGGVGQQPRPFTQRGAFNSGLVSEEVEAR